MELLTLIEIKAFLRIDDDSEDTLLTSLSNTAKERVQTVVGKPLEELTPLPETVKTTMLITVATLYENRQGGKYGIDVKNLDDILRRLLSDIREVRF